MNVRVATYNVKNLFMERDITPGSRTRPKSERSLAALAESVDRMNADVVTFQELSSKETLEKDLLSRRDLSEKYPYVAWTKGNDQRGIRVGIISKYPFTAQVNHADNEFPFVDGSGTGKFSRDLLRVDINTDSDPEADLTVYTTHLKSRRPADAGETPSDVRRLSEGKAVRDIVEKEMKEFPNRMFVVTGDMNDNTDDPPVQAILNGPKADSEKWIDSLDNLSDEARNTWPANPTDKRFPPEQFDHIIFPSHFNNLVTRHEPVRYGQSLDSDTRWVSSAASDHLPIMVDIDVK